jgi:hypothetical protein
MPVTLRYLGWSAFEIILDVVTGARRRRALLPNDAFPLGKRVGPSLTYHAP